MSLQIRAECPRCGKSISILPDGRFHWHKHHGAGPRRLYAARCPGAQYRWAVKERPL